MSTTTITTRTAEQIDVDRAVIRDRLTAMRAAAEEMRQRIEADVEILGKLDDELVVSFGPDVTAEQLWPVMSSAAALAILVGRVTAAAGEQFIQPNGYQVATVANTEKPTGISFAFRVDPASNVTDLAQRLGVIAEQWRNGRDQVLFRIQPRPAQTLDSSLGGGQTQHHLLIGRNDHTELLSNDRREEKVIDTGTTAQMIEASLVRAYGPMTDQWS